MAVITLDDLLGCLEVRELRPGVWTAPNLKMAYPRIFGGQLLAQAAALGAATTEGKTVKSLNGVFPREGSPTAPLEFHVEQTHTGRTFATRQIRARQEGRVIFAAIVSMHSPDPDPGPEYHQPAPDLGQPAEATAQQMSMIPWATRAVGGADLRSRAAARAEFAYWNCVEDRALPEDPVVHQALLAHASDLAVVGTILRPVEGYSQADSDGRLHTAVTSHGVWFHRPFRLDDWCLIQQRSLSLYGGRGFGSGHVFDASGALVANFAQESLIRTVS